MRNLYQLAASLIALVTTGLAAPSDATLKVNDTIRVEVFNETDLNAVTKILKSGEVVLQFIGPVKIAGLTVAEANEKIRGLYDKDYLVDPKLTLTVEAYSQDMISVTGAVTGGGQFPYPQNAKLDLASALAMAGGTTRYADPKGVTVTRVDGGSSTYPISGASTVQIQPGDQITVRRSNYADKVAYVFGQVRKPGPVAFPPDGRLTLLDAIAQAGNYTELGNAKAVKINRNGKVTEVNLREMTEKGSEHYMLQPEDKITVPDRIW
ncbi:polysaccharide biosynthesis/export family protein [Luteolibacter luteus]|uniref:Polysaccharide export outer membrane protein n=1 Tax=Luteolibacter luteus TaxID=2728835 RepID=A0A858RC20_9BACT|nr:polysaccharide biosynthesis/export family protein [Luteolibacter luteus]QJE94272.1 hypothetical protein HHL09_00215 [Luteolibacter luteus]